ncbi:ABC transporter ATP-binding protein [Nocardiopsis sp. N85]|uniref:ABC transporter ATP-binding protein n=1 Tax=Nocardiopsis sp. N85 TaxID=3029400 RepID=UPI00237F425F|nr:ABC transporter ATP-binding protein [Nocardiopsis sp. N85]MDE3721961.1 ABC transporter ATP-binding protein [Nocardiopsis sp. N85]
MSGLIVEEAEKTFGRTGVLHGVDLEVPDGSLGALLGPSGCGKTTLLRLVAGFERLDAGRISVGDRVLAEGRSNHVRPERRGVGVVPQEGALFPHLSVARNVAFGLGRRGRTHRRGRTEEVLELVGLSGYADRMPHELSGGQQQRVALARALAPEPALVLLDEPFNALDPALRSELREEVRQVLRTAGVTALLVTHDPEEALSIADGVALMREGVIVQTGTPREVYERPGDAGLATYLGETVVIPGELRSGRVECALGTLTPYTGADGPGEGSVVVRPERIVFAVEGEQGADEGVPGRIADVTFAGHDSVVHLAVEGTGTRIKARSHRHPVPEVGARVRIRVSGEVAFFNGAAARAWEERPAAAADLR